MAKYKLVCSLFLIGFVLILGKLFYLQIINPKYALENPYLQGKKIPPKRGKIFDSFGQPLALNKESYLLYFEPKKISNKEKIIKEIDKIVKIGEATLEAKLKTDKLWVSVRDGIDSETKEKIDKLNLKGIGFEEKERRYYPEASLSAHILGFVGKNYYGENTGYFGIEGYFEKELAGMPGVIKSDRDLLGRPILIGIQEKINPENGVDIYLTIDKSVQLIAKKRLEQGMKTYQAKEGCVLVVEPENMKIRAAVCLPDFDPENYQQFTEDFFKNPLVSNLYEPGSIFKPLIVAAALEEKKISPNDFVNEEGPVKIGEYSIKTWDEKYEGSISITRVLERSSNVGMVRIGQKLGDKKIYQWLNNYGFGSLTNIELQGEVAGYLKPISQWYPIDFATVTFGQGIAVTPIQFVRAFAALINGGYLMKPQIVDKFVYENGKVRVVEKKIEKKILSERTSAIIKKMLQATIESGEVKWDKPEGYKIGGKTGTAQVPIAGHYDPHKTIASFVGFLPVDKPKFLVLVTFKEPKISIWGSETAAPVFFKIAKDLIVYYGLLPD